ncbi:MAG TPA: hypothetical protein VHB51_04050 [Candidatus Saccharimonadales bacterium]|nr:hypothetical protein [Candidatus Saccharimonadales bacterium]
MSEKITPKHLRDFMLEGIPEPVEFVETTAVVPGVQCDVYRFTQDESKDLGIVTVQPGHQTPVQRVLLGDKTIEGFLDGSGLLGVRTGEHLTIYRYPESAERSVVVEVGSSMQWQAAPDTSLVFSEICEPPYAAGRFENVTEISASERIL